MQIATRSTESVLHACIGKVALTKVPRSVLVPSMATGATPLFALDESYRFNGTIAIRALPTDSAENAVDPVVALDAQATAMLVTLAAAMVPDPFVIEQTSEAGCVATVTAYVAAAASL